MNVKVKKVAILLLLSVVGALSYITGYQVGNNEGFNQGKLSMMSYKDYFDRVAKSKKIRREDVSKKEE